MTKERQQRKQDEVRRAILDAARAIVYRDGIQGLSIRKITTTIDYSPGIIYHYFRDKNAVLEALVSEGYQRIIAAVAATPRDEDNPALELENVFRNYINAVMDFPEEYKAFLLNDDQTVLQRTAILQRGIAERSPTMGILCENIRHGISLGHYAPCDPELTAQIVWASAFGLVIRLIFERDVPTDQIDRLIDRQFQMVFNGILTRKGVPQ